MPGAELVAISSNTRQDDPGRIPDSFPVVFAARRTNGYWFDSWVWTQGCNQYAMYTTSAPNKLYHKKSYEITLVALPLL